MEHGTSRGYGVYTENFKRGRIASKWLSRVKSCAPASAVETAMKQSARPTVIPLRRRVNDNLPVFSQSRGVSGRNSKTCVKFVITDNSRSDLAPCQLTKDQPGAAGEIGIEQFENCAVVWLMSTKELDPDRSVDQNLSQGDGLHDAVLRPLL